MSEYEDEAVPVQDVGEELIKFANEAEEHVSSLKNQTEHQSPSQGSDDNGFVVLPTQQSAAPVVATAPQKPTSVETKTTEEEKPAKKVSNESSSSSGFKACPYYFLGISCLNKVQIPPKVKDMLLWTDPRISGAVFGSTLVLLFSLATFTLLSVASTLLLLALTTVGAYRFYLSLLFRIKGTYDDTFDKISSFDVSLPKDKIQELARLLDTDINRGINQLKSIILWDNIATSAIAFFVVYMVYCVGSIFNTLTILILVHIGLFTLPKVYQIYQVQIDQTIQQATAFAHKTADDIMAKLPFLKKKVQ
jgi:hypothetical protein